MSDKKIFVISAVAIIIVGIFISIGLTSRKTVAPIIVQERQDSLGLSGQVNNTPQLLYGGIDLGAGWLLFSKGGTIGPTQNTAFWRNTTGRTVLVPVERTRIGYLTGTASSSFAFFVATSSTASFASDFAHPGGEVFALDGAVVATSTPSPRFFVGTTTSAGRMLEVRDGQYLGFQVQSRFGCSSTTGVCERATSTNRGISNFVWGFQGYYQP